MNRTNLCSFVVEESTVERLFWSLSSLSVVVVGWALDVLENITFGRLILEENEE